MPVLAIDLGEKHCGFALCLERDTETDSFPLKSVTISNEKHLFRELGKIVNEYGIDEIVIGLPLLNEKVKDSAAKTQLVGKRIQEKLGIKINYTNETYSSLLAKEEMFRAKVPANKRKELIHAFSAKVLLDNWLMGRKTEARN